MTLHYVTGDPVQTNAQILAIGHNSKGQSATDPMMVDLLQRFPAAFAAYGQQCRKGRIQAGTYFLWHNTQPQLMFLAVRDSSVGATRLRYVQSVALTLARDYQRENMHSLAIAPLGQPHEWGEIKKVLENWFNPIPIPVIVYDEYVPGV